MRRTAPSGRILRVMFLLLLLAGGPAASGRNDGPGLERSRGSGGVNAPEHLDKPYVVLVSIDGFRWDYPDRYDLPTLRALAETGARAERLVPVFPTLTFPNHYSIATGLYPTRHGLIGNRFPAPELGLWYELSNRLAVEDGRFYRGEPIWVTAENQGMVAASFFFVGTEAAINGVRPTYWRHFSKEVPGTARVDQVLAWLALPAERRPHLITLYFEDVDDHSHWSGVGSPDAIAAMQRVDGYLARLRAGLGALPHGDRVNVLLVSDHGQGSYTAEHPPFDISDYIDLAGARVVGQGSYLFLYYDTPEEARIVRDRDAINRHWDHGRALRPDEAPAHWRLERDARLPHLLVMPDPGHMVVSDLERASRLAPGAHGWAPEHRDMHGIFIAQGPNIRLHARTPPISAVDIYPLMASLLGLRPAAGLDSDIEALAPVLLPEKPSEQGAGAGPAR